jgi:hypothetical protein
MTKDEGMTNDETLKSMAANFPSTFFVLNVQIPDV